MERFARVTGVLAPLLRDDIDTDAIIPASFMRSLSTDPADGLFARWRYLPDGRENTSFVLNDPRFRRATFLIAGRNFGCGSSRENAVWALMRFGIRGVIAPGFSDIFGENAFKNGLLPIVLESSDYRRVAEQAASTTLTVTVDVGSRTLTLPDMLPMPFPLDRRRQLRLLHGLDEIAETLARGEEIERFQVAQRARFPWLCTLDVGPGRT